jgi:NAD(P)-dependent dehydrogenase (short-subunit alcohol dehydrogenase family)
VALQVSATLQNLPGPELQANYTASNAQVVPTLGRSLAAGANATVTVNLVKPGTMYGPRLNQLDLRFGRAVSLGRARATVNLDLYNALNVDTVLTMSNAYATWQRPQSIILARFAKLGLQFDF